VAISLPPQTTKTIIDHLLWYITYNQLMLFVNIHTSAMRGQKSFTLHRSVAFECQVQLIRRRYYGVRNLGAAKPSKGLWIRCGPVVECDVIVRTLLVRFHFESIEELYYNQTSSSSHHHRHHHHHHQHLHHHHHNHRHIWWTPKYHGNQDDPAPFIV